MFEIAIREKPYSQLAHEYGMTTNAVCQVAFRRKDEIAKLRERTYARYDQELSSSLKYRVQLLTEIIEEIDEVMDELRRMAEGLDLRYLREQSAWRNYHEAFCRYRRLKVEVIEKLRLEEDRGRRMQAEEQTVHSDDLFLRVCPQCRDRSHPLGSPPKMPRRMPGPRRGG
jgi:hypothetical protein